MRVASEVRADAETAEGSAVGGDGGPAVESGQAASSAESAEVPESSQAPESVARAESAVEAEPEPEPVAAKPRRLPVLIAVAALALAIDVVSKILVVRNLSDRGPIHLPGGFLNLVLVRNSGAAFSIGESQTWVFTIIAAAVVFVILRVSRNLRSLPWACALGLLLGGALGNLSDRIFREPGVFRGHVVDFLQFPTFPVVHYDFPVFNLADSAIVAGGCLMVLLSFLGMQPDGTRHAAEAEAGSGAEPEPESKAEPKAEPENKAESEPETHPESHPPSE